MSVNGGAFIGRLLTQPAIPALNLASGKPVVASSSLEGHPAAAAIDGTTSTYWQPAANDAAPSWTVDLGAPVTLASVRILFSPARGPDTGRLRPTLDVSDDQKTWRAVADPSAASRSTPVVFVTNASARFVRLSFPTADVAARLGVGGMASANQMVQLRSAETKPLTRMGNRHCNPYFSDIFYKLRPDY